MPYMPLTDNVCCHCCCSRDHGPRGDRQQTRLIWLIEALGMDKWKELVGQYMGGVKLSPAVKVSWGLLGLGCAYVW